MKTLSRFKSCLLVACPAVLWALVCMIPCQSLVASSGLGQPRWPESVYTDDSEHYLLLTNRGFRLRMRLDRYDCSRMDHASLVFQTTSPYHEVDFVSHQPSIDWPAPFGLLDKKLCWFEAEVKDLDHNQPWHTSFIIKFAARDLEDPVYLQGYVDSLLPEKRLTYGPIKTYIAPAPFGATAVDGGGVAFHLWEPKAERVDLFINDSETPLKMHQVGPLGSELRRHFLYVDTAKPGDTYVYKFWKNGQYEVSEVANFGTFSAAKIDPYAREVTYQQKGGYYNGYIGAKSVVSNPTTHKWQHDTTIHESIKQRPDQWLIYQL